MSDVDLTAEVRKGVITNFVFNVAINGGLTLWLMGAHESLTLFGEAAFGPDLIITGFLLAAIVAAIGMEVHRRKARRGDMAPVVLTGGLLGALARKNRWLGCTAFGIAGALASVVVLFGIGAVTSEMSLTTYATVKGLYAGVLAAAIVYPSTVLGLHLGGTQAVTA